MPFIPNLGPNGPISGPTASQFSYPDIKREKISPPLPQSPATPQQAVPPQAVASPTLAPCHGPGLAISNSSPLPNVAPQFPQTLVHQNPLGVPPNPHPQAPTGFTNFLDAAQNSWNAQFQVHPFYIFTLDNFQFPVRSSGHAPASSSSSSKLSKLDPATSAITSKSPVKSKSNSFHPQQYLRFNPSQLKPTKKQQQL